ncbi:MAG: patatin-like phospholipase family protein [Gemmatimonadaceae bacterium]|nr:patatin-like phospholipase family protein [Gemmatimonadaceae bacterium]
MTSHNSSKKIALVLGGGGLKGFAHLGVLRALAEHGIQPTVFAGTSIGALIAAAHASGMSTDEMGERARALRKRDLFRINHMGMLLERMGSRSIYLEEPLRELVDSVVPEGTFADFQKPLLINTVDIEQGSQVVWGLTGLRNVSVRDSVYASAALPGFFPPGKVGSRVCVDGGVIDNLPVGIASLGMDAIIAVDTGSTSTIRHQDIGKYGFATIYMRAAGTMMHALQLGPLTRWNGPPMILIRPDLSDISWFSFAKADKLIELGYAAAREALSYFNECMQASSGIFPVRDVRVTVIREKCISCGTCVALAPALMALDQSGIAYPKNPVVKWSPAHGDFVHHCPTCAIVAVRVDGETHTSPDSIEGEAKQSVKPEPLPGNT